ncbi:hypothetical protein RI129_013233 [Pyrocoelia pectoralis]|uniref:Aminomethyltransferase n=1 Tax=Pyrocoelia pectoralis TaxID=417401 RepID=A0AAN7V1E6_9COLE
MLLRRLISSTRICAKYSTETKNAIATALYNLHVKEGGKMVNFAGYYLPVQYNDLSITNSHLHTRKNASLFDVSHMLQTEITGNHCVEFFEELCTADIAGMHNGAATLTVFTNDKGGILDDLIVTKVNDSHLYVVSNANRKEQDQKLIMNAFNKFKNLEMDSNINIRFYDPSERSLIALQGPKSAQVLQGITNVNLSELYFMHSTLANISDVDGCRITRCGYTGEDGFEISIPSRKVTDIVETLLKNDTVRLAGLGARDSLRLEAGLCLYGNDITEQTTPVEATLTWLIAKRRRGLGNFLGAQTILAQIKDGCQRKRTQCPHFNSEGNKQIGMVTSGCPGPSIGRNIAMGYVSTEFSKIGTNLKLKVREKMYDTIVTKMPFVKANYYNKPK